ncbi:uncharacterized protein PODANS_2_10360 [Podospora anserina S mat+]|uniref:Podospora anserina S mat+ genomic DNA chromosome 2, supercontig 2 n=1 Tax=Podospora anserina (strain S / ATCC MYA-4624 / DSM 980 / FGSC 10383) TaxID=515849 RepID=B2B797_PODAN|nr:uncharacterized protein PODANS_2_10360 [Podospora anserina S mat+]CAP73675.1 unnamed protein product [Podospora anserina S mat+]CDP26077.1 Putative protein of unknown function [Podospora anserina S mat+]
MLWYPLRIVQGGLLLSGLMNWTSSGIPWRGSSRHDVDCVVPGRGSEFRCRLNTSMPLDSEEAPSQPSIWHEVYNLTRCPGPSCHLGPYCWRNYWKQALQVEDLPPKKPH